MFDWLICLVGIWWLSGPKYALSRWLAGDRWALPIETVLARHGLMVDHCFDPAAVARVFRGSHFWRPDAWWQLKDIVLCPDDLLTQKGDDCDGWAMLHAQACERALSGLGWKTGIVTYLARPFALSHHFTLLKHPQGGYWAVQPQPTRDQFVENPRMPVVFGPYPSPEAALNAIAGSYGAAIRWWDLRDPRYQPLDQL